MVCTSDLDPKTSPADRLFPSEQFCTLLNRKALERGLRAGVCNSRAGVTGGVKDAPDLHYVGSGAGNRGCRRRNLSHKPHALISCRSPVRWAPFFLRWRLCKRVDCLHCDNTGWVCEAHQDQPGMARTLAAAAAPGMPCPKCNPSSRDHKPPRLPKGFEPDTQ
jgi:hypothetical protein